MQKLYLMRKQKLDPEKLPEFERKTLKNGKNLVKSTLKTLNIIEVNW